MRVPATCHSTVRPWGQCSQSTQGWLSRAGGRVASLGLWPGRKESCKSLLLLSTSGQGLLLSQGAISTSFPRQGERGPELLISLSSALQGSWGTQRCMRGPRFMEVQREICYLVSETLSLRSLKQSPSPEKTPLSSEEKPDLHKSAGFVSGCTVIQTSEFHKGWKWCVFPSFFFL